MSQNVIERIGEAMKQAGLDWLERQGPKRESLGWADVPDSVFARAALMVVREPTEEMIHAGVTADHGKTLGERVANSHRAMIDKALAGA